MSQQPDQMAGATPLWTIGLIVDRPTLGAGGTFVEGKDVEVRFWDGTVEHLQYPRSAYNPDTVRVAAQAAAEKHLQVKALQGPLIPADQIAY